MEPAAQPGYVDVDVDPTAPQLHDLMMELFRMIASVMPTASTGGAPLSLSQAFALHELDREVPLSQRDLAELLHLDKSSVSRLAADLERDGLLVRERDPADRRLYRLRLTERGRELHRDMGVAFHRHYLEWTAAMTEDERRALATGLEALVRSARRAGVRGGSCATRDPSTTSTGRRPRA
ncbi:MAG: MarR family transcriptional regulator [Micromonosporaceae bacterium]